MIRPQSKPTESKDLASLSWVARNGISQNLLEDTRPFLKMHNRETLCTHGRAGRGDRGILTHLGQMKREQENG